MEIGRSPEGAARVAYVIDNKRPPRSCTGSRAKRPNLLSEMQISGGYLQRTKSRNACSWCFAIGLTAGVPQTYKGRNCCISHSQIAVIKGCQKADLTMNPEQVKINNTPQRTPLLGRKIKITRSGISWQNETAKGSKITTG